MLEDNIFLAAIIYTIGIAFYIIYSYNKMLKLYLSTLRDNPDKKVIFNGRVFFSQLIVNCLIWLVVYVLLIMIVIGLDLLLRLLY